MSDFTLSIVIPAFNEQDTVAEMYRRLVVQLETVDADVEILFVDDGSSDATARVVTDLHASDPRVGLIRLSRNFGHQAALMAGLDRASGDAVIAMDADLQHPPELLPELIRRWKAGAETVQTVRDDANVGWPKRVTSSLFYAVLRRLVDTPIVPGAADFFLLDRKVVDALNACREHARFTRGLIPWIGFRRELVPYVCATRYSGRTKYSLKKMLRLAFDGLFSLSFVPVRLTGAIGLVSILLALIYLPFAFYRQTLQPDGHYGAGPVLAAVVFMGGIQLTMLWVLGEYVARITTDTRSRPPYVVASETRSQCLTTTERSSASI